MLRRECNGTETVDTDLGLVAPAIATTAFDELDRPKLVTAPGRNRTLAVQQEDPEDAGSRHEAGVESEAPARRVRMSKKRANPDRGSSLGEFLEEEGFLEDAMARAIEKALAWQLAKAMRERHVTESALAEVLGLLRSRTTWRPRTRLNSLE